MNNATREGARRVSPGLPALLLPGLAAVSLACGGQVSETLVPRAFDATVIETPLNLSAVPSFADERGGGIFVDLSGRVVRVRTNGSQGVIESHPGNPVSPGPTGSVWALGPYNALVATTRGLFVADTGWLIAPPWQSLLNSDGLKSTAVGENGVGWIAHEQGLFRIDSGQLSELKVEGQSLTGLTALAVGPGPDASQGVWFAQGTKITSASQATKKGFSVRDSGLTAQDLEGGVIAMAGITPSPKSPGEVWAITPKSLFRFTVYGWQRYELGRSPKQIMSSGRIAWLQAGDGLFRYDADTGQWGMARGLGAVPTLMAVDAAGVAWVRVGEKTVSVSPGEAPRITGLFQNVRVYEPELVVNASLPASAPLMSLSWTIDDGEARDLPLSNAVAGEGPLAGQRFYSVGGVEPSGKLKPVSFNTLADGRHTLGVKATFADGSTTSRLVHFEFLGSASAVISYDKDIKPLNDSRCAKCHTTGTQPELKTYDQWKANALSIATAVREKRMPADGPLDPAGIQAVQRWVNGGSLP